MYYANSKYKDLLSDVPQIYYYFSNYLTNHRDEPTTI